MIPIMSYPQEKPSSHPGERGLICEGSHRQQAETWKLEAEVCARRSPRGFVPYPKVLPNDTSWVGQGRDEVVSEEMGQYQMLSASAATILSVSMEGTASQSHGPGAMQARPPQVAQGRDHFISGTATPLQLYPRP